MTDVMRKVSHERRIPRKMYIDRTYNKPYRRIIVLECGHEKYVSKNYPVHKTMHCKKCTLIKKYKLLEATA